MTWNLQTNLKNKPNAQGTLFSGGTNQMRPGARYKKGYTPERLGAVRRAVQVTDWVHPEGDPRGAASVRGVHETLARSSAPASDMANLDVHVTPATSNFAMTDKKGSYEGMMVHREGQGLQPGGLMRVREAHVNEYTVLHELGHHVSSTNRTEHSRYSTPRLRGEEEGFADHYADQHYVPPKGDPKEGGRRGRQWPYEPGPKQYRSEDGTVRLDHFRDGYNFQRPREVRVPLASERLSDAVDLHVKADADRRRNRPPLPGMDKSNIHALKKDTNYNPGAQ